jgi:hypothetical protein
LIGALSAVESFGSLITYTVDPTQSELTLSGTVGLGNSIEPQEAGSLVTSYTGTITADRDFVAGTIELMGGNVAAASTGNYIPLASSPPSDNYGFYGFVIGNGGGATLESAIEQFTFSLQSGLISPTPGFNASLAAGTITSGEVGLEVFQGFPPPPNYSTAAISGALALAAGDGSLQDNGNLETLAIPIQTEIYLGPSDELPVELSGQLVATATVPEPSCVVIAACAGFLLTLRGRQLWRSG